MFPPLAHRQSESRNCGLYVVYTMNDGAEVTVILETW